MGGIRLNNPTHMKPQSESAKCPNCGGTLLSEICQYCGSYVGEVSSLDLSAEYPTVDCVLAKFTFFGTIFPMIFMIGFLVMPTCLLIPMFLFGEDYNGEPWQIVLFMIPFILVGIGAGVAFFRNVWSVVSVWIKGVNVKGTVYGYMDDSVAYNGVNGQKVKILVYSSTGRKFVVIPLAVTNKPYVINSDVTVRLYLNRATISVKNEFQW